MNKNNKILLLSLPLAALIIIAAVYSLSTAGFYSAETLNWQAQSIGQDQINLFIVSPCLIVTAALAARKNSTSFLIWSGVNLYLSYTFLIYCFDIHFNNLFIVYCFMLGLSLYSVLYFCIQQVKNPVIIEIHNRLASKVISVYFFIISCAFSFQWLSDIIPATIYHTVPKDIIETGLVTNPVHVIDLSIVLPAFFLTAIFLMKQNANTLIIVPGLLVFCTLMDITICWLLIETKSKGVSGDDAIAFVMGSLALLSIILLIWFLKSINANAGIRKTQAYS
jgi:hypothetical protein